MLSKGVESVPSPVRNLREWDPELSHDRFFGAVADQFSHVYGASRKDVVEVDEREMDKNDYVKKVYDELQTWDWQWGQTPEFTHSLNKAFHWGEVVSPSSGFADSANSSHISRCRLLRLPRGMASLQRAASMPKPCYLMHAAKHVWQPKRP
jgi:lipoate-protein ligase A